MAAFLADIQAGAMPALKKVEHEDRESAAVSDAKTKNAIRHGHLTEKLNHVEVKESAAVTDAKTKAAIMGGKLNAGLKTTKTRDASLDIAKKLYLEEKSPRSPSSPTA